MSEPVSIHAPAKEATLSFPRAWRPLRVSIHAPAKEATAVLAGRLAQGIVSIHAPAKEATDAEPGKRPYNRKFQSTPPRRRRPGIYKPSGGGIYVSIHAPAKEATAQLHIYATNIYDVSIHAPAKEATRWVSGRNHA